MGQTFVWETILDGHRVCAYCDMLERSKWPHPWEPEPWVCVECKTRAQADPAFAQKLQGQLQYSALEMPIVEAVEAAQAALRYLIDIWRCTPAGIESQRAEAEDALPL